MGARLILSFSFAAVAMLAATACAGDKAPRNEADITQSLATAQADESLRSTIDDAIAKILATQYVKAVFTLQGVAGPQTIAFNGELTAGLDGVMYGSATLSGNSFGLYAAPPNIYIDAGSGWHRVPESDHGELEDLLDGSTIQEFEPFLRGLSSITEEPVADLNGRAHRVLVGTYSKEAFFEVLRANGTADDVRNVSAFDLRVLPHIEIWLDAETSFLSRLIVNMEFEAGGVTTVMDVQMDMQDVSNDPRIPPEPVDAPLFPS